jgi:predicted MFS family arabinose efflux permease
MLAVYILLMSVPVVYLSRILQANGWIFPVDTTDPGRPLAAAGVVLAFWIAVQVYSVVNGLMYGTRTALFMDITNPAVAATQFTAYMALLNLSISLSAAWQGWAIERFGYPTTLLLDAGVGLLGLAVLAFLRPAPAIPAPAEA